MPVRVIIKPKQDDKGQDGYIAKSLTTADYKALKTEEEKEAAKEITPILGSIKDFSVDNKAADTAGNVGEADKTYTPNDDLPF